MIWSKRRSVGANLVRVVAFAAALGLVVLALASHHAAARGLGLAALAGALVVGAAIYLGPRVEPWFARRAAGPVVPPHVHAASDPPRLDGGRTPRAEAAAGTDEVVMLAALGELAAADAVAHEALSQGAPAGPLHYQLGIIALMRKDEGAAQQAFEAAAAAGIPQGLNSLAVLAMRRRDPGALQLARDALAAMPNDAISRANAERAQAMHDDPTIHAADVHDAFPEHAAMLARLALALRDHDAARAEVLLRRAMELAPDEVGYAAELGVLLSDCGRDGEAIAFYDAMIARAGGFRLLRFNRGNCLVRAGRPEEAVRDYRACLEANRIWLDARVGVIVSLVQLASARSDPGARHERLDEARGEVATLRGLGASPEVCDALARKIAELSSAV